MRVGHLRDIEKSVESFRREDFVFKAVFPDGLAALEACLGNGCGFVVPKFGSEGGSQHQTPFDDVVDDIFIGFDPINALDGEVAR